MNIASHLISHLPFLAAVAQCGSFTRAAEQSNISQAAMSYQIRQLEQKLGVTLVIRQSGSRIQLTNAGKLLAEEYRACEKRLRMVLETIDPKKLKGVLRLTTPVDFGSLVMPQVLAVLQELAPLLKIELSATDELVDLANSHFDFSIRTQEIGAGLEHECLTVSQKSVVASAAYLAKHGTPTAISDLIKHTLLTRSLIPNQSWQQLLSQHKQTIKFSDAEHTMVLGNIFALAEGAKASLGIAVLPNFVIADAIVKKEVQPILQQHYSPLETRFYLSSVKTQQSEPLKKLLLQALTVVFQQESFSGAFSLEQCLGGDE